MLERGTVLAATPAARGALWRRASLRYYVCLGLLVTAALGMHALTLALKVHFQKEPVKLREPLAALKLGPAALPYVLRPEPQQQLDSDVEQSLGTTEYAALYIHDTSRPPTDPAAQASVFITYYTGQPDLVPHVAEECYIAGGFKTSTQATTTVVRAAGIGGAGPAHDEIPVRVLGLSAPLGTPLHTEGGDDLTVMYLFYCNGQYLATRDDVRFKLGNLFERYAYYAKIEVRFGSYDERSPGGGLLAASRVASLEAIGPLMEKLMPVLLDEHFADWTALTGGTRATREGR